MPFKNREYGYEDGFLKVTAKMGHGFNLVTHFLSKKRKKTNQNLYCVVIET